MSDNLLEGHGAEYPALDARRVLDVCWFTYRTNSVAGLMSLFGMLNRTARDGVDIRLRLYGNALVHVARNRALNKLRPEATHVLFVDDDMLCEEDAALKLLARDLPAVSALATNRQPPLRLACQRWSERDGRYVRLPDPPEDLVSGDYAVGTAFLMLSRGTVEKLIDDYLYADDWLRANRTMLDRMHVRSELREREKERVSDARRDRFREDEYLRVFDYHVPDNQRQLSEDWTLSNRLREMGIPVAIDGATRIGHLGEYPYGVWDLYLREDLAASGLPDESQEFDPIAYMPPQVKAAFSKYMEAA